MNQYALYFNLTSAIVSYKLVFKRPTTELVQLSPVSTTRVDGPS